MPPPNLETRVSDLSVVLDAVGSDRPVLAGALEGGAPNVLFAATYPEHVHSIVWFEPLPRVVWTPDFPWGVKPDYVELEERSLDVWGTNAYGAAWSDAEATEGNPQAEEDVRLMGVLSRHTTTPDVARQLTRIWHETDVRGVLPSVQAPALLIVRDQFPAEIEMTEYVASLMPPRGRRAGARQLSPGRATTGDRCAPPVPGGGAPRAGARHRVVDRAVHRHRRFDTKASRAG